MPDCERLQQLHINYDTTNDYQNGRQVSLQTKQGQSRINKNLKLNLQSSNKIKQETDYFIAGPDKAANIAASVENKTEIAQ